MTGVTEVRLQLAKSRRRIDRLDREIVRLLNERTQAAVSIGMAKCALGLSVRCKEREAEVLSNLRRANRGPLTHEQLIRIYREVIHSVLNVQKRLR